MVAAATTMLVLGFWVVRMNYANETRMYSRVAVEPPSVVGGALGAGCQRDGWEEAGDSKKNLSQVGVT
jgi:hypothetical protein